MKAIIEKALIVDDVLKAIETRIDKRYEYLRKEFEELLSSEKTSDIDRRINLAIREELNDLQMTLNEIRRKVIDAIEESGE